ncbi:MAG: hypothetical protein QOJ09_144 [Actinomycetota bacterium]|nr:hypothetical protein [Actinomycetota bacterium]
MSRRLFAALLATSAACLGGWLVPVPAGADVQPVVSISEGQTYKHTYDPLGAPDPSGSFVTPADCESAPGHVCDVIPIHIAEPSDPHDYVVRIRVTFKADKLANGVESSDDIDLYLYDDPPKDRDDPPDGSTDEIMHSAGTSTTESVGIDSEPGRKFSLVVYHSLGQNTGYTFEARYFGGGGVRPDESLEPGFTPKLPSEGGGATTTPSSSPKPRPGFTPLAASPSGPLGGDLALDTGAGFSDFGLPGVGGPSSLDQANANAARDIFGRQDRTVGRIKPVSDATVALWMTISPLALIAVGGLWLMRRRPAALLVR